MGILAVNCKVRVGDKIGKREVIGHPVRLPSRQRKGRNDYEVFGVVQCECGRIDLVRIFQAGPTCRPCATKSHGGFYTQLYTVWHGMKQRCQYENADNYDRYGGRGIRVCEDWQSFEGFRGWALANGYEEGLTIERKENGGNYEPENCTWVTKVVQGNNKRNNRFATGFGETKTLAEWTRDPRCIVEYAALLYRIDRRGWSLEQAIATPSRTLSCKT